MTQEPGVEIPLSYNRDQQLVRLLELPPDLLELIEASSAPHLAFKSAPTPPAAAKSTRPNTSNPPASHIVLTANNKTYQLRQVQTSNSVLLLQASENGIAVTAQCTSTLELEDKPSTNPDADTHPLSALQHLTAALPLYTDPADVIDALNTPSRASVFADIPLSDSELATAWPLLVAFESPNGHAWRPSDTALKDLWRAILGAATLHDIDLGAAVHASTLWDAVDTEHPRELFDALLLYLSPAARVKAVRDDIYSLDPKTAAAWVSRLCQSDSLVRPDGREAQATQCQDLLPEAWHKYMSVNSIDKDAMLVDGLASAAGAAAVLEPASQSKRKADKASGPAAAGGPQRDWHARFKAARR